MAAEEANGDLKQFERQQFINLETFKRSGQSVKTPVWFVQEGEILYVWTEATSGKAKRIRKNARVNIAPCKAAGELLGDWMPARAQVDESPTAQAQLVQRMRKKYGLMFVGFRLMGKLRRGKYAALRLELN